MTAIVHLPTSEFLACGHAADAQHLLVTVPRNPDHLREKYSGDPLNPLAAKSAPEITATLAAQQDAEAAATYDANRLLKAKGLSDLAWRLGKPPAQLTPTEIAAERTRMLTIYKSL